jgi:hypothetical protein
MRRTPRGKYIEDEQALQEWGELIDELEKTLNVRVYGFDPQVSFIGLDDSGQEIRGASAQIPMWLVERILQLNSNDKE